MNINQALQTVSLRVKPDVIRAYAELSDDFNPIHLDPEFAAGTPMGGTIAHGTMSISLIWQALFRSFGAAVFESLQLDVRFIKPIRNGETVTAGGQPIAEQPGVFDVWVRGGDGTERIVGTVRLPNSEDAA